VELPNHTTAIRITCRTCSCASPNYYASTDINAGRLALGADNAIPATSRVYVAAGATLEFNSHIDHIGDLSGAGTVNLESGTLFTGGDGIDSTFSGTITGSFGELDKQGTGKFKLTGANTYMFATRVLAGTLQVDGSIASPTYVSSGATLSGTGFLQQVTIAAPGTINPGDDTNPGTLHIVNVNSLNLWNGAIFEARLKNTATYGRVMVSGGVVLTGSPLPTLNAQALAGFSVGDTFTILNSTGLITGTFANLSDGAAFVVNGQRFQIFYNPTSVVLKRIGNPATHFQVSAAASTQAGAPFAFTVRALDALNQVDSAYTGTVQFSSLDPYPGGATFNPATYTFTVGANADNGQHTFGATLYTAGTWDVTATDLSNLTGSANVQVTPAAADHLLFLQQPTDTAAGQTISPVVVAVVDAYDNIETGDNGDTVTLSLGVNPGGGTLSGTLTLTVSGGLATFGDLSIDQPGAGYTLHATVGGLLPDIDSNPFTITL
jgi:autotransporter-associated beta strand protein